MTTIRQTPRTTLDVRVSPTETRPTPLPASRRFRDALGQGAHGVLAAVEQAASFVPGGAAVSAAVRAGTDGTGVSAGGSASVSGTSAGAPSSASSMSDALTAQGNQAMELLQLQQQIAQEQQQYQTVSNVMKARHDTAKAVIQNVR